MNESVIPQDFVWRRLHSLSGLWLSIYIIFHLLTNAQAALPLGGEGKGFIDEVNWIHHLPFLPVIELALLGVPILIHLLWGVRYLRTSKPNSLQNDGRAPYLAYGRNRAYTWQRVTSYILLVGLVAHIVHMRFLEYPEITKEGNKTWYTSQVSPDRGLEALQGALGFERVSQTGVRADNFGTVTLLMVRDTFKSPLMMALYTIFVLSACYHGFNGMWTFMIKWGVTLTERSQQLWLRFCQALMVIVALLGLAAIFGTYWINLR